MALHTFINNIIEQKREKFISLSNQIWDNPEIRFEEHQSAETLCNALEEEGFQVEKDVAGLETAFIGSYGSGKPVVAILGEFDALEGLSQKKGLIHQAPITENGYGHGCGHNLLGTGSFAAVVAIKEYMIQKGLKGTIRYYGCPAEESGCGKAFMTRAGLFDDVDFALSWHPMTMPEIWKSSSLATYTVYFKFYGKSAHAAAFSHI